MPIFVLCVERPIERLVPVHVESTDEGKPPHSAARCTIAWTLSSAPLCQAAPDQLICTGSPAREVIGYYRAGIDLSDVLARLGLVPSATSRPVHTVRKTPILRSTCSACSTSRTSSRNATTTGDRVDAFAHAQSHGVARPYWPTPGVQFCKPFGFLDYVHLHCHARAVLDSATITRKRRFLISRSKLREIHERPEGFEEAALMFAG